MGNKVRAALGAVLVVLVIAAACSDGDGGGDEERDSSANGTEANESADQQDTGQASDEAGDDPASPEEAEDAGDADGDLVDPGDIEVPEGSDPELRQEYIDALVATAETDDSSGIDSEAAECLSTAFVDAAGTDALRAAVTPQELADASDSPADLGIEFPEDAGDVFYEEITSCLDLRSLILTSLTGEENADLRDCVDDALDDEMIKDYFVGIIIEGLDESDPEFEAVQQRIDEAMEPCIPAQ